MTAKELETDLVGLVQAAVKDQLNRKQVSSGQQLLARMKDADGRTRELPPLLLARIYRAVRQLVRNHAAAELTTSNKK